jgi:hypothetical protein
MQRTPKELGQAAAAPYAAVRGASPSGTMSRRRSQPRRVLPEMRDSREGVSPVPPLLLRFAQDRRSPLRYASGVLREAKPLARSFMTMFLKIGVFASRDA